MDDHSERRGASLYETDFYTWTQEQAALLRDRRIASADLPNIVEELETLGRSEFNALVSAYMLVAHHMLKLIHQPGRATTSWRRTIRRKRAHIEDILEDNPGLTPKRDEAFVKGYARGRRDAANETGLDVAIFPKRPPFTRAQAEGNFWPEAADEKSGAGGKPGGRKKRSDRSGGASPP